MLRCEQLARSFAGPHGDILGLDHLDLAVARGEFVAIRGPSGSGKSTLLLTLGGMLRPSSGRVLFDDQDLYAIPAPRRDAIRRQRIGFVFQLFHLLPYLTVRENILAGLPTAPTSDALARVDATLDRLGLAARRDQPAQRLSAGERQRVALARALVRQPDLILADEPTGNLDPDNAAAVARHLADFHRAGGTVLVVTHGSEFDPHAQRTLHLAAGRLVHPASTPA